MSIVVKDGRFVSDPRTYTPLAEVHDLTTFSGLLDVPADTAPVLLRSHLARIEGMRIEMTSSADGRGFSIARHLRSAGYSGHLRACGPVHCDQYPLALRCGFDDVEIEESMAQRQPEPFWREVLPRLENTYLDRLKRAPRAA